MAFRIQCGLMSRNILFFIAVLLAVCLSTRAAQADIVAYSNFGPNDNFSRSQVIGIGHNGNPGSNLHFANQFTSEATGLVSTVDVGISLSNAGQNDEMQVLLWTDVGGRPGAAIWDGTVSPVAIDQVYSVTSSGPTVELLEGERYWISARANNGTGFYFWYGNSIGRSGLFVFDGTGGTNWTTPNTFNQQPFRVNLANIPEPASFPLLAVGCMLLVHRKRKRKAVG